MEMEEPHENIIMIRGFPVSFPKVSNKYHREHMERKNKHNGETPSLDYAPLLLLYLQVHVVGNDSKAVKQPSSRRVWIADETPLPNTYVAAIKAG